MVRDLREKVTFKTVAGIAGTILVIVLGSWAYPIARDIRAADVARIDANRTDIAAQSRAAIAETLERKSEDERLQVRIRAVEASVVRIEAMTWVIAEKLDVSAVEIERQRRRLMERYADQ